MNPILSSAGSTACFEPPPLDSVGDELRRIVRELVAPPFEGAAITIEKGGIVQIRTIAGNVWAASKRRDAAEARAELARDMGQIGRALAEATAELRRPSRLIVSRPAPDLHRLIDQATARIRKALKEPSAFELDLVGWPPKGDTARERSHLEMAPRWCERLIRLAGVGLFR